MNVLNQMTSKDNLKNQQSIVVAFLQIIRQLHLYNLFYLMAQRIKVFIRPKPLSKEQIKTFVGIDYSNGIISLNKVSQKAHNLGMKDNSIRSFSFTKIFSQDSTQQEIYENSAFSLIENVLEGYNGTIFAYGQTGSGKTYTIMGGKEYLQKKGAAKKMQVEHLEQKNQEKEVSQYLSGLKGIIPRSFNQIITVINSQKSKKHLIQCSFIEIYNENVYDLLGEDTKSKMSLKENASKGLVIQGLKTFLVKSVQQLQKYFRTGYKNRSVRQTSMNKQSSRSHCIFSIKIEEQTTDALGNPRFKVGKLNLVDLAGSQRQSKISTKQQELKQATKINLSLSALGKVINCLSYFRQNQKNYIPYRDSKLTRILQDSLGGNTKTVMIATISQNSTNYQQTLSTLIYASRARFIQNRPILNQDPKDVLLRQYVQEIQKLKMLLLQKQLENEGLRKTKVNFNKMKPIDRHIETIQEVQQSWVRQENQNSSIMQEEEIKKKLQNLQNIVKKENIENEQSKRQLQKMQLLKKKVKKQQQRQAQLEKQKRLKQKQLQIIEKNYKNLNEEAGILRKKVKDLKGKYYQKQQQLQDFKKQYSQQKEDFDYMLQQKDKQIKKLEKILETVLQQQPYKPIINENQSDSDNEHLSSVSAKKILPKFKIQNKAKINFNSSNLYRSATEKEQIKDKKKFYQTQKIVEHPKIKMNSQKNLYDLPRYESEHQKKVRNSSQMSSASYTNTNVSNNAINKQQQKEFQRKESIKKVDSLISLKVKRDSSQKLPFITEVKKLSNQSTPKKIESLSASTEKGQYASKLSFDIARIKDEIINQLKSKSKAR